MKEVFGDAFDLIKNYNSLCITTNGYVKNNGACVMGRGIALTAARKYFMLPFMIGTRIKKFGNHVCKIELPDIQLYMFPVKHNWYEVADIELIKRSCHELMNQIAPEEKVLLPRPGCGNGHLKWTDVKPILEPILDDRISIVHWSLD